MFVNPYYQWAAKLLTITVRNLVFTLRLVAGREPGF
jgi:hypothetical protein